MKAPGFCVGKVASSICESIAQQMRHAANSVGLQVTQGHFLSGLSLVQRVPELVSLYRSPQFMANVEAMLGAKVLPNPNLDLGMQCHLLSTKRAIERGRGVDGFTVWVFCDNVAVRHEGALIIYTDDGAESVKIQPRTGTLVCGPFGDIDHEVEAPLKPSTLCRLTYCDALKVAQQSVWAATPTEARKVLVSK